MNDAPANIHALLRRFLQERTIIPLACAPDLPEHDFIKAGVVPFVRQGGYRFYVMKPHAKRPELGAPPFQLCKGTRQHSVTGAGWQDMRDGSDRRYERESLPETALREGIEELGIITENIGGLYDAGPYDFASATTGKGKRMWLFAAEIADMEHFLPGRDVAATAVRQWMSAAEFDIAGRDDHRYILKDIEHRLIRHFQE